MNFKQQAKGGFKRISDQALLVRGKTVLIALDSNANFPLPEPDLATLESVLNVFEENLAIAKGRRSPEDNAAKKDARLVLEDVLKQLAFYVSNVAKGNLTKLYSSGFEITNVPQNDAVPPVVTGTKLEDGRQSGQMRLDFDKNKSAKMYEYQISLLDENGMPEEWGETYSTTSSKGNIIAPLKPLRHYAVRVRAVNTYGKSDWSQIVTHAVR